VILGEDIMKISRRHFLLLASSATALPAMPRVSRAQAFPSRPVTMIVPFAAGGTSDRCKEFKIRA
jgi:tripartite-type tricarboxylate transporter receptor subunit TctC